MKSKYSHIGLNTYEIKSKNTITHYVSLKNGNGAIVYGRPNGGNCHLTFFTCAIDSLLGGIVFE